MNGQRSFSIDELVKLAQRRTLPIYMEQAWEKRHEGINPVAHVIAYVRECNQRGSVLSALGALTVVSACASSLSFYGLAQSGLEGDAGGIFLASGVVFSACAIGWGIVFSVFWRQPRLAAVDPFCDALEFFLTEIAHISLEELGLHGEQSAKEIATSFLNERAVEITKLGPDSYDASSLAEKARAITEFKRFYDMLADIGLARDGYGEYFPKPKPAQKRAGK